MSARARSLSLLSVLTLAIGAVMSGCLSGQRQDEAVNVPSVGETLALDPDNKVMMKLAVIPAGKFMMAGLKGEKRFEDETRHEVTISTPFYMAVYEVTQEQYEAVMGKNPSNCKGPQNPVDTVSWDDAVAFCKKLSGNTGRKVRLPTEEEWEYANWAGSKPRFTFGGEDTDLGDVYAGSSDGTTHPVGQRPPNAWGLYDMHGNVWEWCADYDSSDSYVRTKNADVQGPASSKYRVLRGGAGTDDAFLFRSANRTWIMPDVRLCTYGFRVAVDLK